MNNICWGNDYCVTEMNNFYDKHLSKGECTEHLGYYEDLLYKTDPEDLRLIDIGCGSGIVSEFSKGYDYHGADLPHIIDGCAKRNYPYVKFRYCDIINDDIEWIRQFDIVVMNALLDVMQEPLMILEKVLKSAKQYVLIHRQEVTEYGKTHVTLEGSYGGQTYHSIISRSDFLHTIRVNGFIIEAEKNLDFSNWENNGNSFLLKKI